MLITNWDVKRDLGMPIQVIQMLSQESPPGSVQWKSGTTISVDIMTLWKMQELT